jgi:signal transduction histidine kinase
LTEISLLSEFAQRDFAAAEQVKSDVRKIGGEAQRCTRALDEIVWAVNPRNDTLDGFVSYACAYAEEHMGLADIRCRLDVASAMPDKMLRADIRHHLFLAFKEALNNVVKHARASEVNIQISIDSNHLNLSIRDNGAGFDAAACSSGNGLTNMSQRLTALGGLFECQSAPAAGTLVKLKIKLE